MIDYKFPFKPLNLSQKQAFEDTTPNLLHDGPWFSGKTHIGAAKALMLGLLYQKNCIALVRKKRSDLKATLWKWFIDKVLPPSIVVAKNETDLYRRIANGTEFYGVGLDSDTDVNKLASREYGFMIVEESKEISEDDFDEKISRCLRLPTVPFLQLMLICNPDSPGHFLYKRFIESPKLNYKRIKAQILPVVPPTYKERMDQLTGVFALRYREGEWVAFEGLVYPYNPIKHLIVSFDIPKDWKRVICIDFGFDHAFVCQWWAVSPGDIWYLYREIYHSRRTVKAHSPQIKEFCLKDGIKPIAICDHDAEDRATLEENGIETIPAKKDRLAGQQSVYDKFEHEQIFFFRDCTVERDMRLVMEKKPASTVEEFSSYIWSNKTKEDMGRDDDHGMDDMRYGIHTSLYSTPIIYSVSTSKSFADLGI